MTTKEFKFSNGNKVIDTITNFRGTITGTCFYLTGTSQYLVTAKCKNDGKEPVSIWFDEGRLELFESLPRTSERSTL